ncbi:MAG: diguanylate cyclase [Gammaproteobacteria bacterium]|nr:diguanylate cyclase [Gammaproteobacteria bacterium]
MMLKYQKNIPPDIIYSPLVLLYQGTLFSLIAHLIMSGIAVWIMTSIAKDGDIKFWFVGVLLILSYRLIISLLFKQSKHIENEEFWQRLFLLGVFLSGAMWGALSLFFIELDDLTYELVILIIVVGISSNSVSTLNASLFAYPLFVFPAILPFMPVLYKHGGDIHIALFIMLFVFLIMTLTLGRRAYNNTMKLVSLNAENSDLISRLEFRNTSLQNKNEEIFTAWHLETKGKQLLEQMFESTDVLIAYMDKDFNFLRVNKAYAAVEDKLPEDYVGRNYFSEYSDDENLRIFKQVINSGKAVRLSAKATEHRRFGLRYCNWSLQPVLDDEGNVSGLLLSLINVTPEKLAELDAIKKEAYLYAVMETAADGIIITDASGIIESINTMGASIFGYQKFELVGKNLSFLMPVSIGLGHKKIMRDYLLNKSSSRIVGRTLEATGRRHNGEEFPVSVTVSEAEIQGRIVFMGIVRDISKQKRDTDELIRSRNEAENLNEILNEKNKQLEYLSSNDALTGLANRRKYNELIEREWERAKRNKSKLSIIIIDIDHFKAYNDFYGHLSGDECLRRVAQLLAYSLKRATDFIARYGGEEFVCVLPDTDMESTVLVAEEFRKVIEDAGLSHLKSQTADVVTVSLGVASMIPVPGTSIGDLVSRADKALYMAKNNGRNRVCVEDKQE